MFIRRAAGAGGCVCAGQLLGDSSDLLATTSLRIV
jgi:hypothetical protein